MLSDLPENSHFWYFEIINLYGVVFETSVELEIILDYFHEIVIKFVDVC